MSRSLAALVLAIALALPVAARADLASAVNAYDNGRYEEALKAFNDLAGKNNGEAMLYIGRMYETGHGVEQNYSMALTWYRRAAARDVPEASYRIGLALENGVGVPQNYQGAVKAYRTASDQGNVEATIHLAKLTAEGLGTLPDPGAAARMLDGAAKGGSKEAAADLKTLVAGGTVPIGVLDELGITPPAQVVSASTSEGASAADTATQAPAGGATTEATATSTATQAAGTGQTMASTGTQNAGTATGTTQPATAQPAESPTATALRKMFKSQLEALRGGLGNKAALTYKLDVSEDQSGHIDAAVRNLRLSSPDFTADIGDVDLKLAPLSGDSYSGILTVPAAIRIADASGTQVGAITIGSQSATGIYNTALKTWTAAHGSFRDIEGKVEAPNAPAATMKIGAVNYDLALTEDANGKWSGPSHLILTGLGATLDGADVLDLQKIEMSGRQRAIDLPFVAAVNEMMATLRQELATKPKLDDAATQARLKAIVEPIIAMAHKHAPLIGGMEETTTLTGLTGHDPKGGNGFALSSMTIAMGARNLDQDDGNLTFGFSLKGLKAPVGGVWDDYVPESVNIDLAANKLPTAKAAEMTLEMLQNALADPASFQKQALMAIGFMALGLQQQMAQAGSAIDIRHVAFVSKALTATMSGKIIASAEAATGAVGKVKLEITGLDQAIQGLSQDSTDPNAQHAAMTLTMLQSMGKRVETGGTVHHVYDFELTPDGHVLLNGNDMSAMMKGMEGAAQGGTTQ